jgi:o-succinylbenzoate synthase
MRIWASRYTLTSRSDLSSRAQSRERVGALLKVETDEGIGYADVHPWTELGDENLELQLGHLASGALTPLTRQSLVLAVLDRRARAKGISAFEGLLIPETHALVPDLAGGFTKLESEIRLRWGQGFRIFKFKVGRDVQAESESLFRLCEVPEFQGMRLRLDFNGSLRAEEFLAFCRSLPEPVLRAVEFVEDPLPWNRSHWQTLAEKDGGCAVPLALDRLNESQLAELESAISTGTAFESGFAPAFDRLIVKPAVQEPERLLKLAAASNVEIVMTSYLDHPVGQMGAVLQAAILKSKGVAMGAGGLASHLSFENNEFSEQISLVSSGSTGPKIRPPSGTGIGFDDLLVRREWAPIR